MKKTVIQKYLLAALFLFSPELFASAESDFASGVKSFKAGNYAQAITYFESAMKQGLDSVALQYNLASCYYKEARYEGAKKYFKLVYQTEAMQDLAQYNLGLIAVKQKQWTLARHYFNSIAKDGKDQKLIALSQKQLVRLTKTEPRTQLYISSNYGYDSNILSANTDSVLNKSDNFYDLFLYGDLLIDGSRKDGWVADASFFRIDYLDLNISDENHYGFGLKRAFSWDHWETSARVGLAKRTFGGQDFQTAKTLDLKANRMLSKSAKAYLSYHYETISSDNAIYDYLAGSRQQFRVEYRNFGTNNIKQIYYELELNNRHELVTPWYAYDYSPTRHTISGKYTHKMTDKWRLSAQLSYRYSDYPTSSTMDRQDQQLKFAVSSDYYIDKTLRLSAKLQFTDNASSQDQYSYDKSLISVGLSKAF